MTVFMVVIACMIVGFSYAYIKHQDEEIRRERIDAYHDGWVDGFEECSKIWRGVNRKDPHD